MPESRPTMVPVRPKSRSWSFTTIGVTDASSADGTNSAIPASTTTFPAPPCSNGPKPRTSGTVAAVARPLDIRTTPSARRGSTTSARRPPVQAPSEIAARATPMTALLVWRVTPT
jgi:hypothetical protein